MDAELGVLTAIIDNKDLRRVLDAKINIGFFEDETNQEVWIWITEYFRDYADTPTEDALKHQFPDFQLSANKEPFDYYIDQLIEKRKRTMLSQTLLGVREYYDLGDTEKSIQWLASQLQDIRHDTTNTKDVDLVEEADTWLDEYLRLLREGAFFKGIPTGYPFLDLKLGGWHPEQFVTMMGLPKAGKSTGLLWSCIVAHAASYKTMFVTFEMSNDEQKLRHHTFRANIGYNNLLRGKLTSGERTRLRKMLNGLSAMQPMIFIHDPSSVMTVSGLAAKMVEHQPEIVFVDGMYLMEAEIPGVIPGTPQALTSITRDMKRLSQRSSIPIIGTTQALLSKYSKRRGLQMESIGYTSSFAQDSDAIIGSEAVEDQNGMIDVTLVAARNASPGRQRYLLDWEQGLFQEVESQFDDDEESDRVEDE